MSLPVLATREFGTVDRLGGRSIRPVASVAPVSSASPLDDPRTARPFGPAARLDLTPLGAALLLQHPYGLSVTPAKLEVVRAMVASQGFSPDAVAFAVRLFAN
ncbi:MAG: hypothetical protein U0556_16930 [Dehalococcoidia bacterium]